MSYELYIYPEPYPDPRPKPMVPADRPRTPTRIELGFLASQVPKPRYFWDGHWIHNAMEAVEHAKSLGSGDALIDVLYQVLWIDGHDINDVSVLAHLAKGVVPDVDAMVRDIEGRKFADQIVPFNDAAYANGVYNVPTFFIAGKRFAEQPYVALQRALQSHLK